MHGRAKTFSEQVIESIIDDSRSGMSGVAFRTVPPIGGLSCIILDCLFRCGCLRTISLTTFVYLSQNVLVVNAQMLSESEEQTT